MNYENDEQVYHSKNFNVPADIHVMNKNEAKLLRQLKAKTGLSEEELRSQKKYRVQLSTAQKIGTKSKISKKDRYIKKLTKNITRELKLPKEHPDVVKRLNDTIQKLQKTHLFWWFNYK